MQGHRIGVWLVVALAASGCLAADPPQGDPPSPPRSVPTGETFRVTVTEVHAAPQNGAFAKNCVWIWADEATEVRSGRATATWAATTPATERLDIGYIGADRFDDRHVEKGQSPLTLELRPFSIPRGGSALVFLGADRPIAVSVQQKADLELRLESDRSVRLELGVCSHGD